MNKILVIEHKIDYLISTKALLMAILKEAAIITSTSTREGIIKAEEEIPDVIAMNIASPGLSTHIACKILRDNILTANIPILLIINSETTSEEKIKCLENGADAFIQEPLKIPELSAQIKSLLRIRKLEKTLIKDNKELNTSLQTTAKKYSESRALSESIYNGIPIGLCVIDDDNFSFINNFLKDFMGITQPIEKLRIQDIFKDWDMIVGGFKKGKKHKSTYTYETTLKNKSGIICPVLINAGRRTKEDGAYKYILNILDISEISASRKLQETTLKIHECSNKYDDNRIFISKIYELITKLFPVNHFYIGIYNNYENVIRIPYITEEAQQYSELTNLNNLTSKVIKTRSVLYLNEDEIDVLKNKGQTNAMESMAKSWLGIPLINNGNLIGLTVIQDNKRSNAFSKKQIKQLEFLLGPVAAILESRIKNKQLAETLIKAQESEKLKNGFLSNISHEIRTPLNAIIGFSSMLYDEIEPWVKKEYLDLIINNGDNLLRIIDDIVDMAKIESGDIKLNQIETNVVELLKKVYDKYSTSFELSQKNLDINLDIPENIQRLLIKTDPFRLNQILENLVSNAIKFTLHGSITLGISLVNKETLNFFISDTGIGIPKKKINAIFARFIQVEEGHVRDFGGNGLGLSITKNLVKLLNGEIFVESEEGRGSKFWFTIPINKVKFLPNRNGQKNKAIYNWEERKILLVDDVVSNLEYLDLLLRKTKAKTIWAQDGKKALELYQNETDIDIIIMDLQMPIMDGYKATRFIKEINPKVPVIIQTAFNELSNKKLAFESGCDYYLQKPIKPNELLETIDKYL